jgi:hypothetical protein
MRSWKDNIKMDLEEIVYVGLDWVNSEQTTRVRKWRKEIK